MTGKCFLCGAPCYWQADFTYEDYCMEGEGLVSTHQCSECGAFYEIYLRLDDVEVQS